MRRASQNRMKSLESVKNSNKVEVEPGHYDVKHVNPKFSVFNRKLLRKAKRKGIKDLNEVLPTKKVALPKNPLKQNLPLEKKQKKQQQKQKPEEVEYEPEKWNKEFHKKRLVDDERDIKFYEKKLGLTKEKGRLRHAKDLKRDGIEDLYEFLDVVDKRIHTEDYNYGNQLAKLNQPFKLTLDSSDDEEVKPKDKNKQMNKSNNDEDNIEFEVIEEDGSEGNEEDFANFGSDEDFDEDEDGDEEMDEEDDEADGDDMEDEEEEQRGEGDDEDIDDEEEGDFDEEDMEEDDEEEEISNVREDPKAKNKIAHPNNNKNLPSKPVEVSNNTNQVAKKKILNEDIAAQLPAIEKLENPLKMEEKAEIEKSIRACVNRVAEGNIEAIFNKMNEIYTLHPKTIITEIYSDLFIKGCIEQPQCLHMIVAANTALLAALYQLYDNPFLAVFTKNLILKYRESLQAETEERKSYLQKNIFLTLALMYDFNIFSAEFVLEIIVFLCDNFSELSLELISMMILNCGFKIRTDNPGFLKKIIDYVREAYEKFKSEKEANTEGCSKKMEFLMMNLNDIKINKKLPNNAKDRLEFLSNWLQKSVVKKMNLIPKIFPPKFTDVISNSFAHPRWYMPFNLDSLNSEKEQHQRNFQGLLSSMSNQEYIRLEKLAADLKLSTDIRKRIFILMMGSQDYIEATQNIMKLKLNRKQMREIAVVILQACSQEENFNKFYAYLAQNMIEVDPNMKYSFQYSIWDHCKQLENYSLRKITNIAKLYAFLINSKVMGISSLKGIDIDIPHDHLNIFLTVFFREFYSKNSLEDIKEIFRKLNQNEELAILREKIKEVIKTTFFKNEKARKIDNQQEKDQYLEKIKTSLKSIETMQL